MASPVYELQGYSIVLRRIAFVTRVFQPEESQGFQFNVRFDGDLRLAPQFPTRHEAELARELLVKALRDEIAREAAPSAS
ncbi:MAG: hypothetical protein R3348_07895 [Xanthomonadales bacterium]|nr:hypothetical protein [Xanthomonadales bacterium]